MSLYIFGDESRAEDGFVFWFFLGVDFPEPPQKTKRHQPEEFTFSTRKTKKFSTKL